MPLRRAFRKQTLEIGLDEAGRGCLAGPVTAAAVVLSPGKRSPSDLNDSKQLSATRREELRQWIQANSLAWAVAWAWPHEIDRENILQATMTAMHRALDEVIPMLETANLGQPLGFSERPRLLLVDGHYFRPYPTVSHSCQKKGDTRFQSIAAASILAKTHRDEHMLALHEENPVYSWNTNKGYPTPPHRRAIALHGPTQSHRRSFSWA